jgi:hypothetical protein
MKAPTILPTKTLVASARTEWVVLALAVAVAVARERMRRAQSAVVFTRAG